MDLVATMQVLLQTRRMQVAESLEESATLVKELANFQTKPTPAAISADPIASWREGKHDLVFAVAIAAWQAERQFEDWRAFMPWVSEPVGARW